MTAIDHALRLARMGFHVFPVRAGTKLPAIKAWGSKATTDETVIGELFNEHSNIGIATTKWGSGGTPGLQGLGGRIPGLLVVDVDNKNGKSGDESLIALELQGRDFPPTFEQYTPSGGRHLVYRVPEPVRQGANVLGPGLDIRSRGGYVVGSGSIVGGGAYSDNGAAVADAPQWLIDACNGIHQRSEQAVGPRDIQGHSDSVLAGRAEARARTYLATEAPKGEAGGRNETAYRVAARLRDFGVARDICRLLLLEGWECTPPLEEVELDAVVRSAYTYAKDTPGNADPTQQFEPVAKSVDASGDDPVSLLNHEYAFVVVGGGYHVLWETTDHKGRWKLEHLNASAFHAKHAAQKITSGKRTEPVTEVWMGWKGRRSFDGLVFMPEQEAPDRFYNLWRGFAYAPAPAAPCPALDAYLEHLHDNVCQGDDKLYAWLMSWFAHLIQKPWEKPHTAIVLRGGKGVGKNVAVETVGMLLGRHFMLTSNRRYLVGNFNGHLEHCLFFALDEAFWSGDKQAEGTLKDLITGTDHSIEHKGKEPYPIQNLTRVAIIGNEDWLVPASHDERRFAVFDVGDGRRQDRDFFHGIHEGFVREGYGRLLRYLLDYRISADVNAAPATEALADQKHASLDLVGQWWFACLQEGRLLGHDFAPHWVESVPREAVRSAFRRYTKERIGTRARLPTDQAFGRQLKAMCPLLASGRGPKPDQEYLFKLPNLTNARKAWSEHMGHEVKWDEPR